ncbi:tetratricopeptide repeat protein [Oscillatoria acuminata]|uniref:Tetratricopeptide repeat protein n=1 Tax=Oscillatoria acuminata PCC 6304 TaxID=56110 RepID=K9TLC2_9CYAN|nr:tetratricopeptide repeat protein [Oscillatoria acuminata]AFY83330.1 tetratricopeptide repeat protein [Oscillatoria acuminata PCC 6304]
MNRIQAISTSQSGQQVASLYQEAQRHLQQGNSHQATSLFQDIIKLQPDFALSYQGLGQIWRSQGKLSPSLRCYLKALELQPDLISADFFLDLGSEFVEQNQIEEAILCYNKALQINPNHTKSYLNLGVMWRKKGELNKAIALYQKAIALDENLHSAYFNLGNIFLEQDRLDEAISAYLETVMIQPYFESAYLNLGQALIRQGKMEEAFSVAIHIIPNSLLKQVKTSISDTDIASKFTTYRKSQYIELDVTTSVKLVPPKTYNSTFHSYFRWEVYHNPETFVTWIPSGRAWGDSYSTAVINSDGRFIDELCQGSASTLAMSEKLPPATALAGTIAFLSVRGGNTYYHWIADLLPRLKLLQLADIKLEEIDFFVVNSSHLPFQRETLNLLGIPTHKIIENSQSPHIKTPSLVVPSLPGDVGLMSPWTCQFLRESFLDKAATLRRQTPSRIYISRRHASYRRILNEEETIARLSPYGFVPIVLESLSFLEQVALFANAKAIIAPHGAGLTNTLFCNPGTQLIEIFSPDMVSVNYWVVSNIIGLDYAYLIGESLEEYKTPTSIPRRYYNHPLYEDIVVNLDSLVNIMHLSGMI